MTWEFVVGQRRVHATSKDNLWVVRHVGCAEICRSWAFSQSQNSKHYSRCFIKLSPLRYLFVAVAHLIIDESSNTDSIRFVRMNSQTAVWCCTPKIRAGSMACYGPTLPSEKKRANGFAGFLLCLAWSQFILQETVVNAFFMKEDDMYVSLPLQNQFLRTHEALRWIRGRGGLCFLMLPCLGGSWMKLKIVPKTTVLQISTFRSI